jgi:hypothetical protein
VAALAALTPLLALLAWTFWRMPYPINEAVAIFEDIVRNSPQRFLTADTSYYRPLYHLTVMAIWTHAGSLGARLAWIKVLHLAPMVVAPLLLVWHLRPHDLRAAIAAIAAAAVLIGSPGYRDNLEIPLAYTAVGMLLALIVWVQLESPAASWRTWLIIVMTVVAIGFKEQGLVIVPVIIVAWWMGAPGATPRLVGAVLTLTIAYLAYRFHYRGHWGTFQQSMGLGFSIIEAREAVVRFGAFPYGMYAYNSVSTMLNVLFAEPTAGLYFITRNLRFGGIQTWEVVNLASSALLTGVMSWAGWRALAGRARTSSAETRAYGALAIALLASAALSFDYSRDRLGGMAAVFYALAAYVAFRQLDTRRGISRGVLHRVATLVLVAVTAGWAVRAYGTVEWVKRTSEMNRQGWLSQLAPRRQRFADRPVYLQIMESMVPQGIDPSTPRPMKRPYWLASALLPQPPGAEKDTFLYSPADAIARGDLDATYEFIRKGWDPDQLIAAGDDTLTRGRTVLVSPLVWAVAQRQRDIVGELLAFGAHVDRSANRTAPCVADAIGDADLADLLRKYSGAIAPDECPVWTRKVPLELPY